MALPEWEEKVSCAAACNRCGKTLAPGDERILSVYDHEAVCMQCKKAEEALPDYKEVSTAMITGCMRDVELTMVDPAGYCFHHFYPYAC